jgi:hypothetical protein
MKDWLTNLVFVVWPPFLVRFGLFLLYLIVLTVLYRTTINVPCRIPDNFLDARDCPGNCPPAPTRQSNPPAAKVNSGKIPDGRPSDARISSFVSDVTEAYKAIYHSANNLKEETEEADPLELPAEHSIAIVFFVLCAAPYLLTFWSSFLLKRRLNRLDETNLAMPSWLMDRTSPERFELGRRVQELWRSAKDQRGIIYYRAQDYAHLYGFLATATLSACVMVFQHAPGSASNPFNEDHNRIPYHVMIPIAVAVAASVSFTLEFGKLVVRLAGHDVSARTYAVAVRTFLAVIVAAFFLPLVFAVAGDVDMANKAMKVAVVGAAVGLLGRRILDLLMTQADSVLHIQNVTAKDRFDLNLIDGINDDEIDRLAEEGVDSVHALAFMSTPQLYFNSIYGLSRICDWQDQALLLDYLGQAKAQSWRENLGIQGAIAAQTLAIKMLTPIGETPQVPESKIQSEGSQMAKTLTLFIRGWVSLRSKLRTSN